MPKLIALRESPVARETSAIPPRPMVIASEAASTRLVRSLSSPASRSNLCLMAFSLSSMPHSLAHSLPLYNLYFLTTPKWILNKQYVTDGILRFFQEEKGYGKGCEVGAMIGYVQNKTFNEILAEVNSHITIHEPSIPLLTTPTDGWQDQSVSHLFRNYSGPQATGKG